MRHASFDNLDMSFDVRSSHVTVRQVEVRLGGAFSRKYRAKGLMPKGPADLTFHNQQDGRDMTVAEYYEEHYHIRLACLLATPVPALFWLSMCLLVTCQAILCMQNQLTLGFVLAASSSLRSPASTWGRPPSRCGCPPRSAGLPRARGASSWMSNALLLPLTWPGTLITDNP